MKKKLFLLVAFVAASTLLFAQSNIDVTYQNIKKITVDGDIILNIYHSSDEHVQVKGALTISAFAELSMKQSKSELKISRKRPISFKKNESDSIVLNLYVREPNNIEAKSKSNIKFVDEFTMETINLESNTSSQIMAIVSVGKSFLNASASGEIVLIGKSKSIDVRSVGGASINTIQTECDYVTALSTTNGECYVKAVRHMNLKANTYGNIFYKTGAEEVVKVVNTFGHIEEF